MSATELTDLVEIELTCGTVVAHLRRFSPLNSSTQEQLAEYLSALAEQSEDRRLWLDFQRVEWIDAAGQSLLVRLMRRISGLRGRLHIANPQPVVREALALNRLDSILDLRASLPAADGQCSPGHAEGFRRSILDDPEDEVVRLIYADWLEDHDDPRGEFIRSQCLLPSLPPDSLQRSELEQRIQHLLTRHEAHWAAPVSSQVVRYEFRRGFIEQVTMTASAFIENCQELARLAPIRDLEVRPGWPACPDLLAVLLAWPQLPRLRRLVLAFNSLGDERVRRLANSPAIANLRVLDLRSSNTGQAGALALVESPYLSNLERLELLGNNDIGPETRLALRDRFGTSHVSL